MGSRKLTMLLPSNRRVISRDVCSGVTELASASRAITLNTILQTVPFSASLMCSGGRGTRSSRERIAGLHRPWRRDSQRICGAKAQAAKKKRVVSLQYEADGRNTYSTVSAVPVADPTLTSHDHTSQCPRATGPGCDDTFFFLTMRMSN